MSSELPALVGLYAVQAYAATLAVLLLLAAALWWASEHHLTARLRQRLDDRGALLAVLGLGFALVLGAGALFAELSEVLDAEDELARFDLALSNAVRVGTPAAVRAWFAAITHLGDTATLGALGVAVALFLVVRRRRALAMLWVVAVAGNGLLNTALKALFARARPWVADGDLLTQGFSFPSGHSSGSVVAYGMLACVLLRTLPHVWHLPVVLFATAIAFSVGSSRIFLNVHYPSDVLAGFASGGAWLTACLVAAALLRHRRQGLVPA